MKGTKKPSRKRNIIMKGRIKFQKEVSLTRLVVVKNIWRKTLFAIVNWWEIPTCTGTNKGGSHECVVDPEDDFFKNSVPVRIRIWLLN